MFAVVGAYIAVVRAYLAVVVATAPTFFVDQISIEIIQVDIVTYSVSGELLALPMIMSQNVDADWRLRSPDNERVVSGKEVCFWECCLDPNVNLLASFHFDFLIMLILKFD